MAFELTEWLDKQLIEKILRKSENDLTIKIIDFNVEFATGKGDNYCSEVFRVFVEYSVDKGKKKKTIFVKVAPTKDGPQKTMTTTAGLFRKEIQMMFDTLKKMDQILGHKFTLSAKGLYNQEQDPVFIAIEDLLPLGYKMADRHNGMDLDHCIMAMQGLARFHAASVLVVERDPDVIKHFKNGMFAEEYIKKLPDFTNVWIGSTKALVDVLKTWPEADKKYAEKLEKLSDRTYELGVVYTRLRKNDFNVINHCDYWVNNMMYRYDNSGKPNGHIMMDFQFCKYASPAIDLQIFLNTSLSDEVEKNHKSTLIQEYCKTLWSTMKEIGCKTEPPNLKELHQILRNHAVFGMILTFDFLPIVLAKKSEVLSIDEMASAGIKSSPAFRNARFREIVVRRLAVYEEMGLLDI